MSPLPHRCALTLVTLAECAITTTCAVSGPLHPELNPEANRQIHEDVIASQTNVLALQAGVPLPGCRPSGLVGAGARCVFNKESRR